MGVSEKFTIFCRELRMSDDAVNSTASRYKRITQRLNRDYWNSESLTSHSLYVGSYGRGTDIHVSDVDIIFQLPYAKYAQYSDYAGNGQSALLQEVKNSIQKTYKSYIRADGQVIKVDFTDGICFEVVPGFINKDDRSYTYPDTNDGGKWRTTDPRSEIAAINVANNECNKNLKRLCRMARAWKDRWSVAVGGLLIDTLAYNFLKDWQYRSNSYTYYDWMTRDFFHFLSQQNKDQAYWLAPGSRQQVWRTGMFEYKALRCYNIAKEALAHEGKQQEWSANQKWQEIYGSKFPA